MGEVTHGESQPRDHDDPRPTVSTHHSAMISAYEENILNWSEHLFNPHYLPPTRYNEKNAMFGHVYGRGSQPIGELDRTTIIRTARQLGRPQRWSEESLRILGQLFRNMQPHSAAPVISPRQERARRSFLQGRS